MTAERPRCDGQTNIRRTPGLGGGASPWVRTTDERFTGRSRGGKGPPGTVGSVTESGSDGSGYVLYDRSCGRYVASGGALTTDPAAAFVFGQPFAAIRLLSRGSCEPLSLVAVRVSSPFITPLAAAG